ncbi:hypothetical protein FFE93_008960 [Yersinia sp. KBS0713]|nr:hypothetical protein FFE93_008960 [Yersinia sp. KBS0713]
MFHIRMRFWLPSQPIVANEKCVSCKHSSCLIAGVKTVSQRGVLRDINSGNKNVGDNRSGVETDSSAGN